MPWDSSMSPSPAVRQADVLLCSGGSPLPLTLVLAKRGFCAPALLFLLLSAGLIQN